MNIRKVWYCG